MIIFIYCFGFRNGNVRATSIELAEPRYQGVVCSMKESFGFIERADVVKEVRLWKAEILSWFNILVVENDKELCIGATEMYKKGSEFCES